MKITLLVEGMSCGHCEKAVKDSVGELAGVSNVSVDLETKKVVVEGLELEEERIKETIEEAGYDVIEIL